ncbi:protein-L-isoaspartate O-methyltransferase [Legionella lytica]|uniref:Protein-L-isoaspartate O-methyltransferase n=1 Tax=Legionella lytica TaxID=96232 RepID=A0ABY4YB85_9GAMM|nr:protein-L-isoaspartate O-methyltransferase [Legionella lytica]USQ14706.1 protein-L-isoaspartate O-methyltransferase [Legionella lytica]
MSYQHARTNMVKQQLRTGDVLEESILSLYDLIPRHEFVPEQYTQFAYSDMQIPLGHGQRMLTPLEEGIILQSLELKGTEAVLEVGTGSGFFTALLSKLCKQVISVDYYSEFTANAAGKLKEHHCENVELITGDACQGWLEKAPYDVVIFTGALEKLTETHMLQVLPGGKLFAIEGKMPVMKGMLYQLDHQGNWQKSVILETGIPSLIDKLKPKEFTF